MTQRSVTPTTTLRRPGRLTRQPVLPNRALTVFSLLASDVMATAFAASCGLIALNRAGLELTTERGILALLFIVYSVTAYLLSGLYPAIGTSEVDEFRLLTRATTTVWGAMLPTVLVLSEPADIWLGLLAWVVALIAVPWGRTGIREIASQADWWGVPVVVIGTSTTARDLLERLEKQPRAGLRPVALIEDDVEMPIRNYRQIAAEGIQTGDSPYAARGISHAVIAADTFDSRTFGAMLSGAAASFPNVIVLPSLGGVPSIHANAVQLAGELGVQVRQNLLLKHNLVFKRIIDLLLLAPLALPALLLVGISALAILIVSPGRAFYYQVREGMGGKPFRMWKLRTMYQDAEERLDKYLAENPAAAEEWRTTYKLRNDPRILPGIGHFLRKTSLDELPQLWNITKGEMSFVGPRPFPGYHLDAFDGSFRSRRHRVRPGLTGLWQVTARADSDLALQEELDTYYIANWSLWVDTYVLTRTPWAVLTGSGAH